MDPANARRELGRRSNDCVGVARSRFDEGRRGPVFEAGFNGGDEPRERRAFLEAARFRHRQHPFKEAASVFALGSEGQLAVDHGGAQRAFGRVVGRLNPLVLDERPQPVAVGMQFAAHSDQTLVPAEHTAQQQESSKGVRNL